VIVEIKASQVKELRDMTGVAMMDCKKALVECEGDRKSSRSFTIK
jgi:elongation factor Ts